MDAADPRDPENEPARPEPPETGDETAEQPAVDESAPGEPVDPWNREAETMVGGVEPAPPTQPSEGSGTAAMPTVPAEEGGEPRWSARAQVPPTAPVRRPMREEEQWGAAPEQPPRSVLPVLIAVVAVILLVIIGLGVWLALRNRNTPTTPLTTGPPTTTAPPTTTTPPPTTTAPPTTTTPPPTTTAPVGITIPDLSGNDPTAARQLLMSLGVTVAAQQVTQPSTTVRAGRVIGTQPGVGTVVLPGQTVTLIISSGPPTVSPTVSPS
jgi:hypothetical protein